MKRFSSVFVMLSVFGCGQDFFVRVDLSLDTKNIETIAIDPGQLRELEVQAIPDASAGLDAVSFVVSNGGAPLVISPNNLVSYTLALPPELEGVPLQLIHKGFSIDPNIDGPVLFGEVEVKTEQGQINGTLLSVNDPRCNATLEPNDFCFGVTSSPLSNHSFMFNTQLNNGVGPIVAVADNGAQIIKAFSVNLTGRLTEEAALNIVFPDAAPLQDMTLLSSNGDKFTVALLQSNQIFIRISNDVAAGPGFGAAGAKSIVSAELELGPGGRDLGGIAGNNVLAFLSDPTGAFGAPITTSLNAVQGSAVLLGARKSVAQNQLGVITRGADAHLVFFTVKLSSVLEQSVDIILPPGTEPASVIFQDVDGGGDDALILDNGLNKRLLVLLLDDDGKIKPNGQLEFALSGDLRAVTLGRFDNNGSLDIAVSGFLNKDFVQFILSPANGFAPNTPPTEADFRVMPPRITGKDPRTLIPVRLGGASQADALVVETVGVNLSDVFIPGI
jgi:hypothetical protein